MIPILDPVDGFSTSSTFGTFSESSVRVPYLINPQGMDLTEELKIYVPLNRS